MSGHVRLAFGCVQLSGEERNSNVAWVSRGLMVAYLVRDCRVD